MRDEGSGSEEMVDIQLGDSLVRETLMNIDTSNFREDLATVFAFALILVLLLLVGGYGPSSFQILKSKNYDVSGGQPCRIAYEIQGVSSLNRLVSVSFQFGKNGSGEVAPGVVQFRYEMGFETEERVRVHPLVTPTRKTNVTFRTARKTSKRVILWRSGQIDFAKADVSLMIEKVPSGYDYAYIFVFLGNVSHTFFQMFFRIFFALATVVCLGVFGYALWFIPLRMWHLEQKLTLPMLVLLFFFNNPFYVVQAVSPSRAYVILDTIFVSLFMSYFEFFVLVLFDSLRFKNRKTGGWFFKPKLLFVTMMFISSVVHKVYDDITGFELPSLSHDDVEEALRRTEMVLYTIYLGWSFITVILAGFKVDVTERYKFNMYAAAGSSALVMMAVVHVLFNSLLSLRRSSMRFVMNYSVLSLFTFLMVYFHWPYETLPEPGIDQANEATDNRIDIDVAL